MFKFKKYNHFLVSIFLLTIVIQSVSAQRIDKNGTQLITGVGFSEYGVPIYAGVDYGILKNMTIGGDISYRSYNMNSAKLNLIAFNTNFYYHFNSVIKSKKVDLYLGPSSTYYLWLWDSNYRGDKLSNLGFAGNIGLKYFLSQSLAIQSELNLGFISGVKFGISANL